ncbi:hypothetical protein LOK49_LG10G01103 [Camellia lanceoleosa]|uniref:Uncharacterized protein n=1 Tax=Camellia lanceoleosa TaxID=1840588 RepID=A0ACC0GDH8_9ERIC|nr:hypothetical protein LOK49_LG10G01103 [Camellia lanceoleosa]
MRRGRMEVRSQAGGLHKMDDGNGRSVRDERGNQLECLINFGPGQTVGSAHDLVISNKHFNFGVQDEAGPNDFQSFKECCPDINEGPNTFPCFKDRGLGIVDRLRA